MNKAIRIALAFLLMFGVLLLPVSALALDLNRSGSITATMVHEEKPVPGGTLTIYQVADMDPEDGELFHYVEAYASCSVKLDDLDADTARDLASYTYYNNIQGQTKQIDEDGVVRFDALKPGLYLLIQWDAADGYYELLPFLISVPDYQNGTYIYDIVSAPKQNPLPQPSEPTEPSKPTDPTEPSKPTTPTQPPQPTEPSEPLLPQTGQTNWPVPILAVSGFFLLFSGLVLVTKDGKCQDET